MKRNTLLFILLFLTATSLFFARLDLDALDEVLSNAKFGYEYIYSVAFMLLSFAVLYFSVRAFSDKQSFEFFRPTIVISSLFIASAIGGSVSYIITWLIWPHFVLDISNAIRTVGVALLFMSGGILVVNLLIKPYISASEKVRTETAINPVRLKVAILVTFAIGMAGAILVFSKLGFIPILADLTVSQRASLGTMVGSGLQSKMYLTLMITIILSLVYLIKVDSRSIFAVFFFFVTTMLLFGYGARFFFVMPALVGLFCYNNFVKRIKFVYVILGFLVLFPLLVVYTSAREDLTTGESIGMYGFAFYLFGEFRDFTYMLDKLGRYNQYLGGTTLMNILYTAMPQQVWEVFGINKLGAMYSSATFSADFLYKANAGIRIGLLGEFFINFGYTGIYIGSFIFGICAGILDIFYEVLPRKTTGQIFVAFLTVNLLFSVIGQIDGVFATIYYYGYILVAALLFIRERKMVYDE
ncbi:MAG: O-antigen polymerase [Bacteroidota bacterium]